MRGFNSDLIDITRLAGVEHVIHYDDTHTPTHARMVLS